MKNIVIKGWMIAVTVFVVMFGGILLTIGTGHWATTRNSEPARLATGDFNPADIRGSYAFSEIEEFFGVPMNVLFEAFMIPEALRKPDFQVKNMEAMFAPVNIDGEEIEVGTDLIRVFTAIYTGLPYDSPESEYMPTSAIQALVDAGKLDKAEQASREEHAFDMILLAEGEIVEEHEEESEEVSIKGRTTMGELLQYGVTKEQFKDVTGVDMPGNALGLRDFVSQNGLDMETVKTGLEVVLGLASEEPVPAGTTKPIDESIELTETTVTTEPETAALDIKGSTSIFTVLDAGLTAEQFTEITGLAVPEETTMMLKDFVDANGLDMETVKAQILDMLTPTTEESMLEVELEPTPEAPQTEDTPTVEEPPQPVENPDTTTLDIKGSTSIGTVLDAGLTAEQFTGITGIAVPEDTTIRLKDFVDANALDMETVRTQILETLVQ